MKKLFSNIIVVLFITMFVPTTTFAVSCSHKNTEQYQKTVETCESFLIRTIERCKDCGKDIRILGDIAKPKPQTHSYVYASISCNNVKHEYAEQCRFCRKTTGKTLTLNCDGKNCIYFY